MRRIKNARIKNRSGQAVAEYAIILAVFVLVLLGVIPDFEDTLGSAYIDSESKVADIPPGPTPSDIPIPTLQPTQYTVTYDANGGTNAPAMQIKEKGVNLVLASNIPIRSAHTFLGWAVSKTRADSKNTDYLPSGVYTKDSSIILFAAWEPEDPVDYTLRFHVNPPSGKNAYFTDGTTLKSTKKQHDVAASIISDEPQCEDYRFLGWNENSAANTATYTKESVFLDNRDADFYAIWTPLTYTVTYHANGGAGSPPAAESYAFAESVTVKDATLTKKNWQFAGWSEDSSASLVDYKVGSTFSMPRKNMDLYAVYMPTEFPYNGTTGADGSIQRFTAPVDGTYQIQLWGARGGSSCKDGASNSSAKGGYTVINVALKKEQTIFFAVGGHGADNAFTNPTGPNANAGGWNGGGDGYTDAALEEGNFSSPYREGSGGGGGATSVYTVLSGDGQLTNYASRKASILGVAGGSAGANYSGSDGYGGGSSGGNGIYAGTQTAGFAFGRGESAIGARRVQ